MKNNFYDRYFDVTTFVIISVIKWDKIKSNCFI